MGRNTSVQPEKELSATIQEAMREKSLDREGMAKLLGVSSIMVDKIICGDVVPSEHLQKQMKEVLGIAEPTINDMAKRREQKAQAERQRAEEERVNRSQKAA
jgi:ribosome-binding protein aMBF1 (putative translation factor)